MSQPSITSFFSSRKRVAVDDLSSVRNKVLVLEGQIDGDEVASMKELEKLSKLTPKPAHSTLKGVKLLSSKKESLQSETRLCEAVTRTPKSQSKAVAKLTFDENASNANVDAKPVATFKKCGYLSPTKRKEAPGSALQSKQKEIFNALNTRGDALKNARKELSLGDIKKNLLQSNRLAELRAKVTHLKKGLSNLDEFKKTREGKTDLKAFKSIDVDVPQSPLKTPTKNAKRARDASPEVHASPVKEPLMSPRKGISSPAKSPAKVPAHIRFASLLEEKPTLTLPHHYRFLAELFRSIDTVSSMLHNRRETVTFAKVKPAVQEMLRRNFTEKHLEQINHLCPDMYSYAREKMKNAGFTSKADAYDLVMKPHLENDEKILSPSMLLERRRFFYNKLVDVVKDHHEQFLVSLDPPMQIARDKLARWHPEFEIEKIAEVPLRKLPPLPNVEVYSTAQDVLERARTLFNCNTRMERALEKLVEAKKRGLTDAEKSATETITNPALKGVPKALLEKIKAKQAAKAFETMTRSSAVEKNMLVYRRLPDLARVLRNLFVTEKKGVLSLEIVISKLDNSFRSKMSQDDIKAHLKMLSQVVPKFLSFHDIRNGVYLRLEKATDLNIVVEKLEKLSCDS